VSKEMEKMIAEIDDIIADIAMRDNGLVFWKSVGDEVMARVTIGDLRKILTVIHQFDEGN
jgi:hypothetical protein